MTEPSPPDSTPDPPAPASSPKRKRTVPARSSRRIAAKETLDDLEPQTKSQRKPHPPQKSEKKKSAPAAQSKQKPDDDEQPETIVTDHGHIIHPNGTSTLPQSKDERCF
jgi:hypothetical protein